MKTFYKRNLPHFTPKDSIYFVTSRLAGTLPAKVIRQLQDEYTCQKKLIADIKSCKEKNYKYLQLKETYFMSLMMQFIIYQTDLTF